LNDWKPILEGVSYFLEMLSLATGVPALLLCWLPAILGFKGYTPRVILVSLLTIIYGIAVPGLTILVYQSLKNSNETFNFVCALLGYFAVFAIALTGPLCIAFIPSFIARKHDLRIKKKVFLWNFLGLVVPYMWIGLIIWCGVVHREKDEA